MDMTSCWSHYPGSEDCTTAWGSLRSSECLFHGKEHVLQRCVQPLALLAQLQVAGNSFSWSELHYKPVKEGGLVELSSVLLSGCCVKLASTTGTQFTHIHGAQAVMPDPEHRFVGLYLT